MGSDPHDLDPLGHLRLTAQEWLQAIPLVQSFAVPILALGGGGYNLTTVPRMWTAAILTLLGVSVPEDMPKTIDPSWGMSRFGDADLPEPRTQNQERALRTVEYLQTHVLPNVGASK
jgi:acetoin utilization protein AcuC